MDHLLLVTTLLVLACVGMGVAGETSEIPMDFSWLPKHGGKCWGFEPNCPLGDSYSNERIRCTKKSQQWSTSSNKEQRELFWKQGDFGYLKEVHASMRILCDDAGDKNLSWLACSSHLRFCTARNIFFDFKSLNAWKSTRYRNDVIHEGEVGGKCAAYHKQLMEERADEKGFLQSWANELVHFQVYDSFNINSREWCDVVFEKPTFIIKLDAAVNMYHHFCDFFNLFATMFLNHTHFGTNNEVLWWDTDSQGFDDSFFGETWAAFTEKAPYQLIDLHGKRVCFKEAIFPLLARQILGPYYNMPLVDGCEGAGIFHIFSRFILDRLGIEQKEPTEKVRITLLERNTRYRRIVNVNEIFEAAKRLPDVEVKLVNYDYSEWGRPSFRQQLQTTYNSDIFIGMHGSGLTHLLFLPDWAAVFELYNCNDEHCYKDLARLRGVKYWTWRRADKLFPEGAGLHPERGTPHKKFTNYAFDVDEFIRLLKQMVEYVRRHPLFVEHQRKARRVKRQRNEL